MVMVTRAFKNVGAESPGVLGLHMDPHLVRGQKNYHLHTDTHVLATSGPPPLAWRW